MYPLPLHIFYFEITEAGPTFEPQLRLCHSLSKIINWGSSATLWISSYTQMESHSYLSELILLGVGPTQLGERVGRLGLQLVLGLRGRVLGDGGLHAIDGEPD